MRGDRPPTNDIQPAVQLHFEQKFEVGRPRSVRTWQPVLHCKQIFR